MSDIHNQREIENLQAEIKRLRADNDQHLIDLEEYRLDVERLRAALEFYGNPDHWKSGGWDHQFRMMSPEPVYSDKGDKARAALEGKHD